MSMGLFLGFDALLHTNPIKRFHVRCLCLFTLACKNQCVEALNSVLHSRIL